MAATIDCSNLPLIAARGAMSLSFVVVENRHLRPFT